MRIVALVALVAAVLGAPAVQAESPAEKAVQKQWKTFNKGELKTLKAAIKTALTNYKTDLDGYFDDLAAGTVDPTSDGFDALIAILHDLYSSVEFAVENATDNLDEDGSDLLETLSPELPTLRDFAAGDGGTLDKTIAAFRKQLAKVDKAVIRSAKKIKKAVAKSGTGEVRYAIVVYPMPLAILPWPYGDDGTAPNGIDGGRPSVFLVCIATRDLFSASGGFVGMSDFTGGDIDMRVDDVTIANIGISPDSNGIHSTGIVATVAAPAGVGWQYDPLGDGSRLGQAIYAAAPPP